MNSPLCLLLPSRPLLRFPIYLLRCCLIPRNIPTHRLEHYNVSFAQQFHGIEIRALVNFFQD